MKKLLLATIFLAFMNSALFASYEEALKLFEKKDYKNSLTMIASELEIANDTKPGSPNYNLRFLAAHDHWELGNVNSAISHFTRCIEIRKDAVEPYIDLAMLQLEIRRYGDAEATAIRGLAVKKSPMLYYLLGLVSLKRENFWKAKEMLERANSLNPELYYSYNALGIVLMRLKKYGEANTAFTAAYVIKPKSVEILNNLGRSYEVLGKRKEALEYYERAAGLDGESKVVRENLARLKKE
jgi:tetratricopeptide (TPR) repeat protein